MSDSFRSSTIDSPSLPEFTLRIQSQRRSASFLRALDFTDLQNTLRLTHHEGHMAHGQGASQQEAAIEESIRTSCLELRIWGKHGIKYISRNRKPTCSSAFFVIFVPVVLFTFFSSFFDCTHSSARAVMKSHHPGTGQELLVNVWITRCPVAILLGREQHPPNLHVRVLQHCWLSLPSGHLPQLMCFFLTGCFKVCVPSLIKKPMDTASNLASQLDVATNVARQDFQNKATFVHHSSTQVE